MAQKVTKFVLHSDGMRELVNEDFVRDDLTTRAGQVLAAAQAGGGGFQYHIEQATTDRVAVRIGSDDEGVLFYEGATGNLLRALDRA